MSDPRASLDSGHVKSCCADAYASDWAHLLLGDSFHPGGLALTRRLGALMGLGRDSIVLDVACGRGTSAIAMAQEFGCRVTGIDLSEANVAAAREVAARAGLTDRVRFEVGDGEALPVEAGSIDAVICECAFCTFPDKITAAGEFARVLRPGGVLGLTDLTREGEVAPELDSLLGWVACVADAQPLDRYVEYLGAAGLIVYRDERCDSALQQMVSQVRLKLLAAEVAAKLGKLAVSLDDVQTGKRLVRLAGDAVAAGTLGYALLLARAPEGS
ncbi:MAG: class I SAM-dependent methyltransferase [Dehalococcoidia bacterium]